jgi:pimeloyl-ACP methyl ester carboxylesterase
VKNRYVEQGSGEPVVLLHGQSGSVQGWFNAGVFQKLAVDHRVIAFDARGHGESGKPHDPKQYGREMALDVVRLLDHLSIPKAHIVGYSMGSMLTSQLLTLHPERFLTATLGAHAGRFQWNDEEARMAEEEASEREKECVSRSLILRLALTNGPKPNEDEIKQRSAACFADATQDRFALAALARGRRGTLITPTQAAAITVPTLAIAGSLDPLLAGLEELKKIRPTIKLVVIEGTVHFSTDSRDTMRHPAFIAAVREFIGSHRQDATQSREWIRRTGGASADGQSAADGASPRAFRAGRLPVLRRRTL